MSLSLFILMLIVIGGATAAMTMRNLIHCALALALTFLGLAGLYLDLNAQFIGWAQILVYVGAVSIVILFAILLTRGGDTQEPPLSKTGLAAGGTIAVAVFGVLAAGVGGSHLLPRPLPAPVPPEPTVAQIGQAMMLPYVVPVLAMGVLLTAALLGALLLAMKEKREPGEPKS